MFFYFYFTKMKPKPKTYIQALKKVLVFEVE